MVTKIAVTFLSLLFSFAIFASKVSAEVKEIEADGYYTMGDGMEENQAVAKERARANAKRAASERASIFIESISEVRNGRLTRDEVRTISSIILQVLNEKINPEIDGNSVRFHCHITVQVDTDTVAEQLKMDRRTLNVMVRRNMELEAENSRISEELDRLKKKFQSATETERQKLHQEIKHNENQFTVAQWNQQGVEFNNSGEYKKAVECFLQAVKLAPDVPLFWYNLGIVSNNMKNYDKAISCYVEAIKLAPNNAEIWYNLGLTSSDIKKYDKAISCYLEAIKLEPDNAEIWNSLGLSYFKNQQFNEALEAFNKAVELNPNEENFRKNRDNLLAELPA